MKKTTLVVVVFLLSFTSSIYAQVKKFGKVSKEELATKSDAEFKDADAVVLFKKRRTYYDYDGDKGFVLMTEVHERIKLYNKEGFEYATKKLQYYIKGKNNEEIMIKAATYNLEGKKVIKTKLRKKDIFVNKENKFWGSKSFTMPNLKEGCIIEWKYTIESPFATSINDIVFQYNIPIKYIDAKVRIPEYYIFNAKVSKYYMIKVEKSKKNRSISYTHTHKEILMEQNTKVIVPWK